MRTLVPAVTQVSRADSGGVAAVVTRAGGVCTLPLILVTWAVTDIITEHVQGQAVATT